MEIITSGINKLLNKHINKLMAILFSFGAGFQIRDGEFRRYYNVKEIR